MIKKKDNMKFPNKLIVGGITYKVLYVDKASDTDAEGRQAIWGQIDYWTRTIRIYQKNRTQEDIYHTLFHEIIHAISQQYQLNLEEKELTLNEKGDDSESSFVDIFSLILYDTLQRNGWLRFK